MDQEQFVTELSRLRSSSTFLSLIGYRNSSSEVADYSLIFNISYENALRRSIVTLESIVPENDYAAIAKKELIDGYQASLDKMATTPIEEIDDNYTRFFNDNGSHIKGIKLHTATNVLHLYGFVNHKRVLMPGQYKTTNRRLLTIAKDKLRKLCAVNKFRQFIISPDRVDHISVQGLHLLPPTE